MKVGKWFAKREGPVIYHDDVLVNDEWYQYYRKCTKNTKEILSIMDSWPVHGEGYSKTPKFWDEIIEIRALADIKDPEEMKEWLLHCKKEVLTPKRQYHQTKAWSERRKVLYSWLKRAKAVGIAPLPSNRPFSGQRKEWEESIVRAERISKTKNGKYTPGDGAYKWECIDKLKSLQINDSLRVEGRVHQTVDWWLRYAHYRMKEFSDKRFIVKEIDHNTQIIWRVK